MGGFGDAVKYLYEKFILRDVLSFITPGAIIVVTATYLLFPEMFSYHIPWPLYIPLFGFFYMVGFATQCLGEMFGLIRFSPYTEKSWRKRWSMFLCSWDKNYETPTKSNIWWWTAYKHWDKFLDAVKEDTGHNERERQVRERLVIFKQMCANSFLAGVISVIFIAVNFCPWQYANLLIVSLAAFLLLASLFWGHRVHELRQYTQERLSITQNQPRNTS
jgi:hypothetical protein